MSLSKTGYLIFITGKRSAVILFAITSRGNYHLTLDYLEPTVVVGNIVKLISNVISVSVEDLNAGFIYRVGGFANLCLRAVHYQLILMAFDKILYHLTATSKRSTVIILPVSTGNNGYVALGYREISKLVFEGISADYRYAVLIKNVNLNRIL